MASERKILEELQWRASLKNPRDRDALLANPDAIELTVEQIEGGGVFVSQAPESVVGFATILTREDGDAELDALFVEPALWQRGIDRVLVEHCCAAAKAACAESLHVVGNSHAEGFYSSCRFVKLGTKPTCFGMGLLMKRGV